MMRYRGIVGEKSNKYDEYHTRSVLPGQRSNIVHSMHENSRNIHHSIDLLLIGLHTYRCKAKYTNKNLKETR